MFHIVPSNQNKATPRIDGSGVEYLKARLPVLSAANEGGRASTAANHPQNADEQKKAEAHAQDRDEHTTSISAYEIFDHDILLRDSLILQQTTFCWWKQAAHGALVSKRDW
jgi:hypothetical protein